MKFTKMHGCGNDYIYIDAAREPVPTAKKPELVRALSDRHFGIGSDGVIFIHPSAEADFEMEMYNADGSRAEMCGNGIRCVGKYVYDKKLTDKEQLTIISAGKTKALQLSVSDGKVEKVRVAMGAPELLPILCDTSPAVNVPLPVDGQQYCVTCVSMGNPHAVIFLDEAPWLGDLSELDLERIGPRFENHPLFPNRINTEFVTVSDRHTVSMRVWERGAGETLACGTGCCAVAAACVLNGRTDERITVKLRGGELEIFWDRQENQIYMTGPAVTVFEGEIDL